MLNDWDPGIRVNRQPICLSDQSVWGYEVKICEEQAGGFSSNSAAVARTVVEQVSADGLDQLVGSRWAALKVPWDVVARGLCASLPKDRVVIEVADDGVSDADLFEGLATLSKDRFHVAISDGLLQKSDFPLATVANVIRLDLNDLGHVGAAARLEALREYPVRFLAENVSTCRDFEFAQEVGFDCFQGYFFCVPDLKGREVPLERLTTMRLLARLQDPAVQLPELEQLISHDLALAHRLLQFSNSAYVALARNVESIRHAASMVGIDRLRMWATLLLFSNLEEKPRELVVTAVVRAKMCEVIATQLGQERTAAFFTVGLFSVLDAVLDCTMSDALASLPLSDEICRALLDRDGVMGTVLNCVEAYERSDWGNVVIDDLPVSLIRDCYLTAVHWTDDHTRGLCI